MFSGGAAAKIWGAEVTMASPSRTEEDFPANVSPRFEASSSPLAAATVWWVDAEATGGVDFVFPSAAADVSSCSICCTTFDASGTPTFISGRAAGGSAGGADEQTVETISLLTLLPLEWR
jgi:hypothetical protein